MPRSAFFVLVVLTVCLMGCGPRPSAAAAGHAKREGPDASYVAPPAVTGASLNGGRVALNGTAQAGSRVRLAAPNGAASLVTADAAGRWRLSLSAASEPRLFGLSLTSGARTVQGQGYLLLTPGGEGVLLRSGAGALRLGARAKPGLTAFDFDRQGGAVVSGTAAPGSSVTLRGGHGRAADGRADSAGRFAVALAEPLGPGLQRITVIGDFGQDSAVIDATPAAPLAEGPIRSVRTAAGLRVDWMTPGGGVQSTLITD